MNEAYQLADLPERLRVKITVDDAGCWIWTASKNGSRYGHVGWDGRVAVAHRVVRNLLVGDVEVFPGRGARLVLDHLCRVRACVNPAHCEPVTNSENCARGANGFALTGKCRNGLHDVTDDASVVRRDGKRQCRECKNDAQRAWRAANLDDQRAYHLEYQRAWRARRKAQAVVS